MRGRTISVVYLARVDGARLKPKAADDAAEVGWHRLDQLPPLAFDHEEILALARKKLAAKGTARASATRPQSRSRL